MDLADLDDSDSLNSLTSEDLDEGGDYAAEDPIAAERSFVLMLRQVLAE